MLVGLLKAVRCAAKVWARRKRAPPILHQNCKFVTYLFDLLEEARDLSAGEQVLRHECRERLALSIRECAAYWKQRGKFRAVREGDADTAFFHTHASGKLRRNQIRGLEIDGVVMTQPTTPRRLCSPHTCNTSSAWPRRRPGPSTSTACTVVRSAPMRTLWLRPSEVRTAVRAINCNRSPGPDGFGLASLSRFGTLSRPR